MCLWDLWGCNPEQADDSSPASHPRLSITGAQLRDAGGQSRARPGSGSFSGWEPYGGKHLPTSMPGVGGGPWKMGSQDIQMAHGERVLAHDV